MFDVQIGIQNMVRTHRMGVPSLFMFFFTTIAHSSIIAWSTVLKVTVWFSKTFHHRMIPSKESMKRIFLLKCMYWWSQFTFLMVWWLLRVNMDFPKINRVDCVIYHIRDVRFLKKSTRNLSFGLCCDLIWNGQSLKIRSRWNILMSVHWLPDSLWPHYGLQIL